VSINPMERVMEPGAPTPNLLPMGGDPDLYPPYSKARQDAELEALRFAFCEMAALLHEQGGLDLQALAGRLGNAQWAIRRPDTQASVAWLAETLVYMRSKQGEPGGRP